ncbi:Gfo/Idh/MocA family oxidoreductase [Dactylosporangium roseum]|uniref:Gfo/Idh/MocA family oxidoreductase n=1 Tax=Dactylosporangium roseum TaxID=47989 RepID=A0ABY5YYH9_9ACTN|nr:Gfo/Idh/MocA family oxidoreductase [Dactylosporangium roseum]UWZ34793.1 Gfo/Idh/MocA family oxidoreductase [Dactylosporangium roseum]
MRDSPAPAVRFGTLGCADIALRRTLPAMRAEESVELVAVASRAPERATKCAAAFGADAEKSYDDLLRRPDVEAVYLPLPTGLHHEWASRALAAGKHVLAEKPLATSHSEAADLAGLARAGGLVLMENLTFHRHPVHRLSRELVESGRIGELRSLHAEFAFPPLPDRDIRYRPDLGGGALLDAGVYPAKAARMFLGEDLTVVGAVARREPRYGVDIAGSALLARPDGVTAHLTFGFEHFYRCAYTLWGSTGRLEVGRAFTPPPQLAPPVRLVTGDGVEEFTGPPVDQFQLTLAAFARAVRGPRADAGPVDDALRQAQLIDLIAKSSARALEDSHA